MLWFSCAKFRNVLLFVYSFSDSYEVGKPSIEDRNLFFGRLVEAALSVSSEGTTGKSQELALPELPKAPKVASGPKVSELKAKVEAEQHALRRLRMCLRDVCNRYYGLLLFVVTCINIYFFYLFAA